MKKNFPVGRNLDKNISFAWKERWAEEEIYTVSCAVAKRLVGSVGDLERLRVEDWYNKENWRISILMKLLEWVKTEEVVMTQGNDDHQWSFTVEEASKNKVGKMTSLVAVVNFSAYPPCSLLYGPRYRAARVAEMVTTIETSPPRGFWQSPLLSAHLASSRGQHWAWKGYQSLGNQLIT